MRCVFESENEIRWRRIIDEQVSFKEHGVPLLLTEMSVSVRYFKDKIESLDEQLIENWCLCKYCQLFDKENQNFNHWKNELYAVLQAFGNFKLKSGNKSKIMRRVLIDIYEYNTASQVKNVIRDKFIDEKFPVDGRNEFDLVASEFANEIGNIIDVVCNGDGFKQYASLKFN